MLCIHTSSSIVLFLFTTALLLLVVKIPPAVAANGNKQVIVDCATTKGAVEIVIEPEWAPLGAQRFLELVDDGFFHNLPLFRCVKDFLCQFGYRPKVSHDGIKAKQYGNIKDDPPQKHLRKFKRGYISAAGNGKDSRSSHFFVTLGQNVASLGTQPWETPIGYVTEKSLEKTVSQWHTGYGDMPPYGDGADPQKIVEGGASYLEFFPAMDYWRGCVRRADGVVKEEL